MRPAGTQPPVVTASADGLVAFLALSPDAVVLVDDAGRIVAANDASVDLFGYPVDDLVGRSIEVLVPEEQQAVHTLQRTGFTAAPSQRPMGAGRNLHARRRDGTQVPVDISLAPLQTDDGLLIAAVVRDVTERQDAELRLAAWVALFDRARFGVIVSQAADGTIIRVNPAAAEMHGYARPDDMIGMDVGELFPPEERPSVGEYVARTHHEGRYRFEAPHVRADGSVFPTVVDLSAIRDESGDVAYRVAFVQDVTEERAAASLLRSWQERFHTSVEAMPDAVLFFEAVRDPDGRIVDFVVTYANDAALSATRTAGGLGLHGTTLLARFPRQRDVGLFDDYRRVVATGESLRRDLEHYADGGLEGSFVVRAARLGDGVVVVLHDVTDRKAAEDRLQAAFDELEEINRRLQATNEQLEAANRHQEQFVSMASHELRTPLTTIQGFAETLELHWDRLDDDRRLQYLQAIQRSVERQTVLLSDLLDVSRIRAGRLELDLRPVDLRRALEESVEAASILAGDVVLPSGPLPEVRADEVRLIQILVNLLTNAGKYGAPPIEISVGEAGDRVEIRVRDHGPGVTPEFEPHLFEMFAQASRGDRRTATGTGLGLHIVSELAVAQGGEASYERPADGGSSFVVRLPRA